VAQRNPNTMTLDDMYQIATDTQREAGPKIKQAITAVQQEDDDEVAAFQRRKNKNSDKKKTSSSNPTAKSGSKGYSSTYRSNTGPGNNNNRNGKYCFYCKLQNHTQDECFKRI
jgi:hypothetical protein